MHPEKDCSAVEQYGHNFHGAIISDKDGHKSVINLCDQSD